MTNGRVYCGQYHWNCRILRERFCWFRTTSQIQSELLSKFKAATPLLAITVSIVQFSNRIEEFAGQWIPGTACTAIAVLAPWF
jgi:hypothetical protein